MGNVGRSAVSPDMPGGGITSLSHCAGFAHQRRPKGVEAPICGLFTATFHPHPASVHNEGNLCAIFNGPRFNI